MQATVEVRKATSRLGSPVVDLSLTSISPCIFTIGVSEDVIVERLIGLMKLGMVELSQYLDANKHSNMGAEAHPRKKPALSLFLYATYEAIERHQEQN